MARPPRSSIWAAGGVVARKRANGEHEYLLVHRKRYDDWSLPKGKLDRGESYREAALREIEEETGFKCEVTTRLGTVGYVTPAGINKVVRYWLLEPIAGEFRKNSEVNEIAWLTARQARARASYSRDRALLRRAGELVKRPGSGRIYLTRHALAGDRAKWKQQDRLRPLSKRGRKQAATLAAWFSRVPVEQIYTSPWARCEETIAPLARALGLKRRRDERLSEGARPKHLRELIAEIGPSSAVLSTHGDVIARYIERLAKHDADLDGPMEWKKASIWVLDTRQGKVRSGRYVPPPL